MGASRLQGRHAINDVHSKAETIDLILDGQVQRRVDVSFLLIPADMKVLVIGPPVRQAVDQPGIAMEVEDDRSVFGEQAVEVSVRKAVRMFSGGDKSVQVNHVHKPDLEIRKVL